MFTVFFWSLWNSTRTHFNFVSFLYSNNIGYYMQIVFVLIVILNNFLIYFMTTRIIHEASTYRYTYLVKPQDSVGVFRWATGLQSTSVVLGLQVRLIRSLNFYYYVCLTHSDMTVNCYSIYPIWLTILLCY